MFEGKNAYEETNYVSEYGVVMYSEGVAHAVTYDGEYSVPVPSPMANVIALGLKLQDRVLTGRYPKLTEFLLKLNCRKSAFVATGQMTQDEAVDISSEDIHGTEMLFRDIERLQGQGSTPVIFESDYRELRSHLDNYRGSFPCIVHLFEVESESLVGKAVVTQVEDTHILSDVLARKMHRNHSFIVLGQEDSGYVCFQNKGASIDKPLCIVELQDVLDALPFQSSRKGIAFYGPASTS